MVYKYKNTYNYLGTLMMKLIEFLYHRLILYTLINDRMRITPLLIDIPGG